MSIHIYMGMHIYGAGLRNNYAHPELKTVRLTKAQFAALAGALSAEYGAAGPRQSFLEAYEAGFKAAWAEIHALQRAHNSSEAGDDNGYGYTGGPDLGEVGA